MARTVHTWKITDLASAVHGTIQGDESIEITRAVPAGTGGPTEITFAGDAKYLAKAVESNVGVVIVGPEVGKLSKTTLVVAHPRNAFGMILGIMRRLLPLDPGIHPSAVVSPGASIDPSARIGAHAVIEDGAEVGKNCRVYAQCYVGEGCVIGDESVLNPRVTLYQDVIIGKRCVFHSGVVIGGDGFGFVWDGKKQIKVPQIGGVVIGDDVEVGANTCIDRATAGDTMVSDGVKLDNMVQIAHNVVVGEHTVLASQVGVSGSVHIGKRVVMGGQAGVKDHMVITDDVVLGGRSGVIADMEKPGEYFGLPAVPHSQAMRSIALQLRLPELFKRVRELERTLLRKDPE